MLECTITLLNSDPSLDSVNVLSASDTVAAFSGNQTFNNLPVSGTTGTVSGDCTGAIDPLVGCTLSAGASVSFLSNQYVVQAADPSPLPNTAAVVVQDLCNVQPTGCSNTPVTAFFGASTVLVSGCLPGLACTATPTPTNTPVNTPTNTPTNTPPVTAPPVPTLSFPMMAMLGLLLAGAGLFLARR